MTWGVPTLVALLTILAFLPSLSNGFVTWDDDKNFLNNPNYRGLGPSNLAWMWTTFRLGHYVPLSWMTLGLDYVAWGMNPFGYHLTSLLLHAANAVVLWFLARTLLRLCVRSAYDSSALDVAAACAALAFALHPLRVESVAWATERRDVLSLLFYLLSVATYLRFAEQPQRARRAYWLSLALFACALLSKATSMTLPAILLILNVYPLRRVNGERGWLGTDARGVYLEVLPFAVLSAASIALSIVALEPPAQLPLTGKIAVSAYSFAFYLWKTLVPTGLSPLYQMPQAIEPLRAMYLASYAVVAAVAALAWTMRKRHPGVTTALVAFTVIVLPMLGVVQNGPQIAADRYTYHASPALALLAGAAVLLATRRQIAVSIAGAVLLILGVRTWQQTRIWHDSDTLWTHALAVDPSSSIALSSRARSLLAQNRVDDAYELSARAVSLAPGDAEAHNALGVTLARQGKFVEAVGEYRQALALAPRYSDEPHNNWGVVRAQQGDLDGAIEQYVAALGVNPENADAQVNWGNALVRLDRPDDAIAHYAAALAIRPDHADAHLNWGVALARQSKFADAIEHFRRALAIDPSHAEARQYLEQATRLLQPR
jgi:Tfp pilus assembly protein PilF